MNMKWVIILVIIMGTLCLVGCQAGKIMEGRVERITYGGRNCLIEFDDGRKRQFVEMPEIPIHKGDYIIISYSVCTSNHSGDHIISISKKGYSINERHITMDNSTLGKIIMCPRCQHSLRKGVDY